MSTMVDEKVIFNTMDINEARQVLAALNTNPALQAVADRLSTAICRYEGILGRLKAELRQAQAEQPSASNSRVRIFCMKPTTPRARRAVKPYSPSFEAFGSDARMLRIIWNNGAEDACARVIRDLIEAGQEHVEVRFEHPREGSEYPRFTVDSVEEIALALKVLATSLAENCVARNIKRATDAINLHVANGITIC